MAENKILKGDTRRRSSRSGTNSPPQQGVEKAQRKFVSSKDELRAKTKRIALRLRCEIKRRKKAESTLKTSEARFHSLISAADHHIFVLDPTGNYLCSNRESGRSASGESLPYVGSNQEDFHSPEVSRIYSDQITLILQTRETVKFQHIALEEDGRHLHLDTLYPVTENGRVQAIGGICRDITEIQRSERRLQYALEATTQGVWDWNIRTGEVFFSERWKTSLGYSPAEVPHRIEFWEAIVHPEDMPRVRHELDAHLSGQTPVYQCENRLRMKSGAYRYNSDRGKVVEWDSSGTPVRMVGTDTDITEQKRERVALAEAKHQLSALLNATRQAVFLMDPEGIVLRANEELARRIKLPLDHIIGKRIYDFLPPEVAERRRQRVQEAIRSRMPVSFEDLREDRVISQVVYPIVDAAGGVVQLAIYGEDVTEQRLAQDALRLSEDKYRRIVETANEGIWAMDGKHRTTFVNGHMAAMLGYTPEEMIGRPVETFMFAEDLLDHTARMRGRHGGEGGVYERRFRRKDDQELWTIVSATALKDAESGFAGSFAMFTDITSRKAAETRYRIVADNTYNWEFWRHPEGRFLYCSPSCARITGYTPEDFQFRPGLLEDIIHPSDRSAWTDHLKDVNERKVPSELEFRIIRPDGEPRWIGHVCQPVFDESGIFLGERASNRDITRRKQADQVLKARLELSEAAAGLGLEELLQKALDDAERLTESRIGFFHFLSSDEKEIQLQMWSTGTLAGMCSAEGKGRHYAVDQAGVWVDCIRERRAVIHNDYRSLPHRKGLPPGHAPVDRELVVPILRNDWIVAAMGVGNKQRAYDHEDVNTVSTLANLAWDVVLRRKAEEQLEIQALVLDQAQDRVTITDLNGVIRYTNAAECRAIRRRREEIIGRHVSVFGEDADHGATQQQIIDATLNQGEWRGEVVNYASDGQKLVIDLRAFLVRDVTGKAVAMCGIGTDITQQRKVNEALRQSEQRLKQSHQLLSAILEHTHVLTAYLNADFNFIWVNRAYAAADGRSPEDFIGRNHFDLYPNEENERIFKTVIETGAPFFASAKAFTSSQQPERGVTYWDWGLIPITNPSGRVEHLVLTLLDVTERVRAGEALRESEARYRALVETSPLPVLALVEGRIVYGNPAGLRMFGIDTISELTRVPITDIIAPEYRDLIRQRIHNLQMGTPNPPAEFEVLRRNGTRRMVESTSIPIVFGGKPGALVIGQDITERRKVEAERRELGARLLNAREEERRHIAREIHDELGQNVNALKIDINWLKKRVLDSEHLAKLDAMNLTVGATLDSVRRISAQLRPGILDMLGLTAAIEWTVRDFEKRTEIRCVLSITPEDLQVEPVIATTVFRILQESLTNVARHAQADWVKVDVKQKTSTVELVVVDNGIGIPEAADRRPGALGLLGIQERLAVYSGTLYVYGLPGEGTTLRAIIPIGGGAL